MNLDIAIQDLVRRGAVLFMRTDPTPIPVTWWRRVNAGRHFYFTPGDTGFDGHAIDYATETVLYEGDGMQWLDQNGKLVAFMGTVEGQVDDPEEAKMTASVIAAWKEVFEKDQSLRAFVLGEYRQAG